jgi:hypothetical protein
MKTIAILATLVVLTTSTALAQIASYPTSPWYAMDQ